MEEQEKNLEGFIEGLYNVKIKPEYVGDELVKQQIEENGFKIKMEIKSICTYNIQLNIPEELKRSEKPDYIKEKLDKLKSLDYVVSVEKSAEMNALGDKTLYDGSNPA